MKGPVMSWFEEDTQHEREMHQLRTRNANRARRMLPGEVIALIASLNERDPSTLCDLLDELDDSEGSA